MANLISKTISTFSQSNPQEDDFKKVGKLVQDLLDEKGTEFYELKKENDELKEQLEKFEDLKPRIDEMEPKFMEIYEYIKNQYAEYSLIDEKELKSKIVQYLKELKKNGKTTFSDFDLMEKFKVPIEAIDKALIKIEDEGLVAKR